LVLKRIHHYPQEIKLYCPTHLHLAVAYDALQKVVADIIDVKDSVRDRDRNGSIALHIACQNNSSFEILQLLVQVYPKGRQKKNKEGKIPIDYIGNIHMNKRAIELLTTAYVAHVATIASGVGGEAYTRKTPEVEQKLNIERIETLHFPQNEFSLKQTDTVIIEYCGDSRVLFTENKNSYKEFKSKHEADRIDIRDNINLYEVLEEAKVWEKTKYHVHENNCHVFALNIFNFCLKSTSRKKMQPKANQSKAWIFSKLQYLGVPIITLSPSCTEISNTRGHKAARARGKRKMLK